MTPIPSHVSTLALFGYLATVYSWLLELGAAVLHVFAGEKLDLVSHVALATVSLGLTAFTYVRGKRDFKMLRGTSGRIPLTGSQVVVVSMFVIALGATAGMVAMRVANH